MARACKMSVCLIALHAQVLTHRLLLGSEAGLGVFKQGLQGSLEQVVCSVAFAGLHVRDHEVCESVHVAARLQHCLWRHRWTLHLRRHHIHNCAQHISVIFLDEGAPRGAQGVAVL